ncbi:hypothetical protein [Enterobacter roggenkampii]|uniref:hypothetical protein n=1 Tax=Enterobacter roggenkampii TaxID=1812935 RepID=UPI002A8009B0|nr:hypothetical protein [Enterobacter roggenkampii]
MFYDDFEFEREQEVIDFINNKIKRCRKCGNELHYKEKFYNTDKLCNGCKGKRPFDEVDAKSATLQSKIKHVSIIPKTEDSLILDDTSPKKRTATEKAFLQKYMQWQLNNEKAVKDWQEKHALSLCTQKSPQKKLAKPKLTNERLSEIISDYDLGQRLNISQDELISVVWEIMYHRGITNTF